MGKSQETASFKIHNHYSKTIRESHLLLGLVEPLFLKTEITKGKCMKTKTEIFNEIENYVKNYAVSNEPKGFIPVVYTLSFENHTDLDIQDLKEIECLVNRSNPNCVGRITIWVNLCVEPPELLIGVAVLPKKFKNPKALITNVPFKPIFERAG